MKTTQLPNIARDNHYVPQALLRRWSVDDIHVFSYRVLVAHCQVPEWKARPIRGIAFHRDLYTTFAGGKELDNFETFLNHEYEQPALEAIDRLVSGLQLTPSDWRNMTRFVAAQDIRTPLSFIELLRRWEKQVPELLDSTLNETIERLHAAKAKGQPLVPPPDNKPNEFGRMVRVTIERNIVGKPGDSLIRAEVQAGRQLWIATMRHLLKNTAAILCRHRWSVAEPFGDLEWPITDHPALRLNYYKLGQYDFGGGWGNPGSEIMMPVSPRHLLYVQVGAKKRNRFVCSLQQTEAIQRLLVERAHRWIFAKRQLEWVPTVRPRIVDQGLLESEREQWRNWHQNQMQSEILLATQPRVIVRQSPEIMSPVITTGGSEG